MLVRRCIKVATRSDELWRLQTTVDTATTTLYCAHLPTVLCSGQLTLAVETFEALLEPDKSIPSSRRVQLLCSMLPLSTRCHSGG